MDDRLRRCHHLHRRQRRDPNRRGCGRDGGHCRQSLDGRRYNNEMTKPFCRDEFITFSPFDRLALAQLIRRVAMPGVRMAEIGSWLGNGSTQVFLEELRECPGSVLLCVDTWKGTPNVKRHHDIVANFDVLGTFQTNVEAAHSPVQLHALVAPSTSAASLLADAVFDLVFIDADHSYSSVRDDIAAWRPKVRPGGVLCGHDCEARLSFALDERARNNRDVDTIPGEGTPFREVHPGSILAIDEAFGASVNLFAETPLILGDGDRGLSTIWYITVGDATGYVPPDVNR
jgi:predicted O-methyltransferase YrrM